MNFLDLTAPAYTSAMTLDAVLERLAASPDVEAVVLVGSTGTEKLHETSDYDVFIAVASDPPPLGLALTMVDGRVAEFVFFSMAFVERAAAEIATTTEDTWAGSIAPRFATGRLVFDRHGRFAALGETIRAALPLVPYKTDVTYSWWFKVNYNLMQTRRMTRSSDPAYRAAVEYRLLREEVELWTAYCAVRGLAWRGEKEIARHLAAHDPDYLARFWRCVRETDRERKFALYTALAAETVAPVGGLWADDITAVGGQGQPERMPDALAYWQRIVTGTDDATQ